MRCREVGAAALSLVLAGSAAAESGDFNIHIEPGVAIPTSVPFPGVGGSLGVKLDIPVAGPVAAQIQGHGTTLPTALRNASIFGVGAGVRVRVLDDKGGYLWHVGGTEGEHKGNLFGNLWFDGALMVTGSDKLNRLGVDVGLGTELSVLDGLQLGPYVRFISADDLLFFTSGLSLSLAPDSGVHDPDVDHDGVVEGDKCPKEIEDKDGFQDEDGCPDPDNDQDGLLDAPDMCPDEAEDKDGFQDEDGCIDADNDRDGIPDTADKCVMEPEDKDGFQDADGCPEADNDSDGLLDAQDKCPTAAEDKDGFQDEDGCPELDNDNDRIPDTTDQCPLEAETVNGTSDEDGCPEKEAKVFIEPTRVVITEKVFFASNKADIQPRSFDLLKSVADVLKKFPVITKVSIEGHTDDVGLDAQNLLLSDKRAKAVMAFLVKQGVEQTRLDARGFGETKPVEVGTTEEAREKNRRVEFQIVEPAGGVFTPTEPAPAQ